MKIIGIILTGLVLLLTSVPCCTEQCDQEDQVEHTGGQPEKDACSPFLSCGSCPGFVIRTVHIPSLQNWISSREISSYYRMSHAEIFVPPVWQPPKVTGYRTL